MGPQPIVSVDSSEAQIIADCVEDGMSISLTLLLVNKHCRETEQIPLTRSVVNDTIKQLSPKSSTIKKSKQGSRDAASKWARARFRWTKQLMIRLGLLDSDSPKESLHNEIVHWAPRGASVMYAVCFVTAPGTFLSFFSSFSFVPPPVCDIHTHGSFCFHGHTPDDPVFYPSVPFLPLNCMLIFY
jgi:hypothetical protein